MTVMLDRPVRNSSFCFHIIYRFERSFAFPVVVMRFIGLTCMPGGAKYRLSQRSADREAYGGGGGDLDAVSYEEGQDADDEGGAYPRSRAYHIPCRAE